MYRFVAAGVLSAIAVVCAFWGLAVLLDPSLLARGVEPRSALPRGAPSSGTDAPTLREERDPTPREARASTAGIGADEDAELALRRLLAELFCGPDERGRCGSLCTSVRYCVPMDLDDGFSLVMISECVPDGGRILAATRGRVQASLRERIDPRP